MAQQVVVVGGGISGLAAAWRLSKSNPTVELTLLEAGPQVGGTAQTVSHEGYLLETGPNGFLDSRAAALELCRDAGLGSQLVRASPQARQRYIFLGDRLRPIPLGPWDFLKSDLLSFRGKLRVLMERWTPSRPDDADETIFDFGARRIGREATENLLDAFVTGILAGDTRLLSLPACFPRMREMERSYGGLFRAMAALAKERRLKQKAQPAGSIGSPAGTLTTLAGGMGRLMEHLASTIHGTIRCQARVRRIERVGKRWLASGEGFEPIQADAVVLACPSSVQSELLGPIHPALASELAGIRYAPAVVVALGYDSGDVKGTSDGFGYLSPHRLGRPVLGVLFSTTIFPDQSPPGKVAFRAILGGWGRPDVLSWSDDQLVDAVRADLKETLGILAAPNMRWIYRWPAAIPQYHLGHRERVRRIESCEAELSGLFLTGNALRGVAIYECAEDAHQTALRIQKFLASAPSSSFAPSDSAT